MLDAQRPIFFCHIPKTAGTSLRRALEARCQPHEIVPDDFMLARNGNQYPSHELVTMTVRRQRAAVKLVRGHYPFSLSSLLENPIRIVVLRDPVERVKSAVRHFARSGLAHAVERDFARGSVPGETNSMTRYLGSEVKTEGFDRRDVGQWFIRRPLDAAEWDTTLSRAKEAIMSAEVVGFTSDIPKLEHDLRSFGIDVNLKRENVAPPKQRDFTDAEIEAIHRSNTRDADLYKFALQRRG